MIKTVYIKNRKYYLTTLLSHLFGEIDFFLLFGAKTTKAAAPKGLVGANQQEKNILPNKCASKVVTKDKQQRAYIYTVLT